MSNLYRVPSINDSYQVLVHSAELFQRRIFLEIEQPEIGIAYGDHACLTDGEKMRSLCRGAPIDAPYQYSVYLAKRFQRRRIKCEKLTDGGRRKIDDGRQKLTLPFAFGKVS